MDHHTHLYFSTKASINKPETISNRNNSCPFCRVDDLKDIIADDGPIILLRNKYSTLKNTLQTVLIETNECDSELSTYNKEHLHKVIRFAITNWLKLASNGGYKSVILFKNHGPLSGGTISHPHMQIVGLETINYMEHIKKEIFSGKDVINSKEIVFNISQKPKIGFYELNILLHDIEFIDDMADYIQTAANFFLNHFWFKCDSYNLFFYQLDHVLACKVIPRFITTPLYIGYSIPQVSEDIDLVAEKVRVLYYAEK